MPKYFPMHGASTWSGPRYSRLSPALIFHFLACAFWISVLLSLLLVPQIGTSQIQPTFSLILLRVSDLLLKQRCSDSGETLIIPPVHLPRPRALGKLGYLKPTMFCSFSLACSKRNPADSAWFWTLYRALAAKPSPCWKLLQLQSPIRGHHTCI